LAEEYKARYYVEGDELGIVELLKAVFPEWARRKSPVDYWRWKYRSPPLGSTVSVALDGSRVIGVSHDIYLRMKIGDSVILCEYGDDAATHPDYQGRGVYKMVNSLNSADQERRGADITYLVSVHPAFSRFTAPNHFSLSQDIVHLVKVLNARAYSIGNGFNKPQLAELGFRAAQSYGGIRSVFSSRATPGSGLRVVDASSFDESATRLWDATSRGLKFNLVRCREHLNWRYADPRAGRFTIRQAYDGDLLVGYAVAEVRGEGASAEGYIMDVFVQPGRLDATHALASSLLDELGERGVNSIHYRNVEGHTTVNALEKHGFIMMPGQQKLQLKIVIRNMPLSVFDVVKKARPEEVHFSYGDYV